MHCTKVLDHVIFTTFYFQNFKLFYGIFVYLRFFMKAICHLNYWYAVLLFNNLLKALYFHPSQPHFHFLFMLLHYNHLSIPDRAIDSCPQFSGFAVIPYHVIKQGSGCLLWRCLPLWLWQVPQLVLVLAQWPPMNHSLDKHHSPKRKPAQ